MIRTHRVGSGSDAGAGKMYDPTERKVTTMFNMNAYVTSYSAVDVEAIEEELEDLGTKVRDMPSYTATIRHVR